MKKFLSSAAVVGYVLMAFFTNAYIQRYRWEDWTKNNLTEADTAQIKEISGRQMEDMCYSGDAGSLFAATIAWPVYWTFRGMDAIVANPPKIVITQPPVGGNE